MPTPVQVIADHPVTPGALGGSPGPTGPADRGQPCQPEDRFHQAVQSVDDPTHLVILERCTSAASLTAHRGSEHFQGLGARGILPLLDERTVTGLQMSPWPGIPDRHLSSSTRTVATLVAQHSPLTARRGHRLSIRRGAPTSSEEMSSTW